MSRHTYLKGMIQDGMDDGSYSDGENNDVNLGDYTEEEADIIQDLEAQTDYQFSRQTVVNVLESEKFDIDFCLKILEEVLAMHKKYSAYVHLDDIAEIYYNAYWKKADCEKELNEIIRKEDEKREKDKQAKLKREEEQKKNSELKKQKSKNSGDHHHQHGNHHHMTHSMQKQDSQKTERFKQETDISKYNSIYPIVEYGQKISEQDELHSQINLVTVGHVDSGKSTLVGHIRHLMSQLEKNELHKLKKTSKENNKESFLYAYGQDESSVERERGVTIDVGIKTVKTSKNEINFLDSPGHRDFVPNMISGTAQADYALLVIDSGPNSFEAGFERGGQTKEHAYLIKAFGVTKVIVAVNKMDLHKWDKDRFTYVSKRVLDYMMQLGFEQKQIRFIPIAAFSGQNLVEAPKCKEAEWYKDQPTLLQLLESLKPPKRDFEKPLRLNIFSSWNKFNVSGLSISGKMEGGIIQKGDNIVCQPHGILGSIKEIIFNDHKVQYAKSGDNIEVLVHLKDEKEEQLINSGNVLCGLQRPIPITKQIIIEFVAFDLINPVLKSTEVMIYINTSRQSGFIYKITKLIDKNNGATLKKNPKCIKSHDCAEINLKLNGHLAAEIYANFTIYGRVILREFKQTIGVGTIKEIL